MKKIIPIIVEKVWGYEKWIYSPYPDKPTKDEDGNITTKGPLIKIIKTNQDLSLQVHPDDKMAQEVEGIKNGKSESWLVLEASDDTVVGLGFKNYDPELIRKGIKDSSIEKNINYVNVKKDDFVDIPAGGVHALGKNITVLEVQQASDTTYRYYDYNRPGLDGKPRELHIEKSIKAQKDIKFDVRHIDFKKGAEEKTLQALQVFGSGKKTIDKESVVVDINSHEAFVADKNEVIELEKYLILPL